MRADLLVLGKGVVGGALLDLLASDRAPEALHLAGVVDTRSPPVSDAELDALARSPCPVVVDATPADGIAALYRRALSRGIHVVTANKKPLVLPWPEQAELFEIARAHGATIGRSATVGAGLPILRTIRDRAAIGDRIRSIDCVLSGTLAFLCDELTRGVPLSRAIAVAKERGYTEPDPREDLEGADVARKAVIVARELGFPLELADVALDPFLRRDEPLDDAAWRRRVEAAAARGERLVYHAHIAAGRANVALASLPAAHPAAASRGAVCLAAFTTDRYAAAEPLVLRGPGAGGAVTASALVADILELPSFACAHADAGTTRAGAIGAWAARSASVASSA